PYGDGHINDTFLVETSASSGADKFILQRINSEIFQKPEELMENIKGVTCWLRKKIMEEGGDPARETLNLRFTADEKPIFRDASGSYWRVYDFINNTSCFSQSESVDDFYQSALSFGHFQRLLADYPAHTLHETIPHFHDTPVRFANFEKAVETDSAGRAGSVRGEIAFVMARREYVHTLTDRQASGELPLRVTHNDTKLNNILIDNATGKGICVIDLDTVMPGLSVNDFGDSI
ncbi:MAG TPA: mucin desulfatase, partial [Lachnospiraceae bacterium]|nr:mucin desulfatase [Lachnospiraceae bacterium]